MSSTPHTIRIVKTSGLGSGGVGSATNRVASIQLSGSTTPGGVVSTASGARVVYSAGAGQAVRTGTPGSGGTARWSASAGGAHHHRQAGFVGGVKRPLDYDFNLNLRKYSRTNDKSKGLRHFSTKVCEKVKEKGRTNYNEVADELVSEYFESIAGPAPGDTAAREKQQYDMKNIRRRVYDALNVLMAMNIIEKEKKEIRWVGLPTSSIQECRRLEEEKARRLERIKQKAEQLQELVIQMVAYKALVSRNKAAESSGQARPPTSALLYLPYIVLNTHKNTQIDCSISHDKTEYLFQFDRPFEIHDDIEVLKRLGLALGLEKAQVPKERIPEVKALLPSALQGYVDEICEGRLGGGQVAPSVRPTIAIQRTASKFPQRATWTRSVRADWAGGQVAPSVRPTIAIQRTASKFPQRAAVTTSGGNPVRVVSGGVRYAFFPARNQGEVLRPSGGRYAVVSGQSMGRFGGSSPNVQYVIQSHRPVVHHDETEYVELEHGEEYQEDQDANHHNY